MAFKKTHSSKLRSKKIIGAAAVAAVILVIAVLELTNTTHFFHSSKAVSGKIPVKQTSKSTSASKSSKEKASSGTAETTPAPSTAAKSTGGGGTTSGAGPQTPFGSFVSNHSPSLSNGSGEQSTCITSPGAACTITFTNESGVVKTLEAQTTDSNGSTSWNWDAKTLTEGNWTIKATATLNGQTQSVTDKLPLTVKS